MNIGFFIFFFSLTSLFTIKYYQSGKFLPGQRKKGISNFYNELSGPGNDGDSLNKDRLRFIASIFVTLIVLGASLFVILKGSYSESTEKWAFASSGTIIGYWLNN